jgi:hypothetical protein
MKRYGLNNSEGLKLKSSELIYSGNNVVFEI